MMSFGVANSLRESQRLKKYENNVLFLPPAVLEEAETEKLNQEFSGMHEINYNNNDPSGSQKSI